MMTPLSDAIKTGNIEIVKTIVPYSYIDENFDDIMDLWDYEVCPTRSYLHCALYYENMDIFKYIFELSEDKFPKDCRGRTPFYPKLWDDYELSDNFRMELDEFIQNMTDEMKGIYLEQLLWEESEPEYESESEKKE